MYEYQVGEINTHNIFDVNRMDEKQFYTALSRTTKLEHVNLDETVLLKSYHNRKLPDLELINAKHSLLFKNGKIYEVLLDNELIYVGSTCEELETRLKWHKNNNNSQVYKHKNNNPDIKLIVNAPCKDRKELEKIETEYIILYSEKYGEQLLNKKQ